MDLFCFGVDSEGDSDYNSARLNVLNVNRFKFAPRVT